MRMWQCVVAYTCNLAIVGALNKCHKSEDTPSDLCLCKLGAENTDHFFLLCPFYNSHRTILRSKVDAVLARNDITLLLSSNLYLYGHESISYQDNREIIMATLEFISSSNRFDH